MMRGQFSVTSFLVASVAFVLVAAASHAQTPLPGALISTPGVTLVFDQDLDATGWVRPS